MQGAAKRFIKDCGRADRVTSRYLNQSYPAFFAENPGIDSGRMILSCTTAALVNEIRSLCIPAGADSLSTCANWEDPVSTGWWAARKSLMVAGKLHYALAIEIMTMSRASDMTDEDETCLSTAKRAVRDRVRQGVSSVVGDRHFGPDIESTKSLVHHGKVLNEVQTIVGPFQL